MQKITSIVLVSLVFLTGIALGSAEGVPTSNAVQVPQALALAIGGLVLAGVIKGLDFVFFKVGLDLRGLGTALATVISGFAVAQLQGLIDLVPAQYDQLVGIALSVAVVILSGVGALSLLPGHGKQ